MTTAETIRELADHWSAVAGIEPGVARLIISEAVTELTTRGLLTAA